MTCREWLRTNGYLDVVVLIDRAMAKMGGRGSKQRRNWWDILSGGPAGKPCVCEGMEFPVLRVAQIRQGKPTTMNAISRNDREKAPDTVVTGRWTRKEAEQNLPRPEPQQGKSLSTPMSNKAKGPPTPRASGRMRKRIAN